MIRVARVRRNLVPNPSFEADTTGWTTNGTIARDISWSKVGAANLHITRTISTNDTSLWSPYFPVIAGVRLPVGAALKIGPTNTATGAGPRAMIEWSTDGVVNDKGNSDNAAISWPAIGAVASVSGSGVVPAGAAFARLRLVAVTSGLQTVDIHWDAVYAGTSLPYFDGNFKGRWEGAANASASRRVPILGARVPLPVR